MKKLILTLVTAIVLLTSCRHATVCEKLLNQRSSAIYNCRPEVVTQTDSLIKCLCKEEARNRSSYNNR